MKNHWRAGWLLVLLPFYTMAQGLTASGDTDGILVSQGPEKILYFHRKPTSLEGQYKRADYIHPLYAPDGAVLTEDFPADHPHHRGVFWAWHQLLVNGTKWGDAWECKGIQWDVQSLDAQLRDSLLQLRAVTFWKARDPRDTASLPQNLLRETTLVTVHPRVRNYRILDFEIALSALVPGLRLGGSEDAKGYGGFSVRMRLPEDIRFKSAGGPVTPEEVAVPAASWMDISGSLGVGGAPAGILIVSLNEWDQAETRWILREQGSMQNPVFPGRQAVDVPVSSPLVLRYRLVVYGGTLPPSTRQALVR